jgi:N-methylhydantoinase A/oxoprolinase/acetone carboxylase beta subunit
MMTDRFDGGDVGSKVIAVDVGGTFIDVVSIDRETGERSPSPGSRCTTWSSTRENPSRKVSTG